MSNRYRVKESNITKEIVVYDTMKEKCFHSLELDHWERIEAIRYCEGMCHILNKLAEILDPKF